MQKHHSKTISPLQAIKTNKFTSLTKAFGNGIRATFEWSGEHAALLASIVVAGGAVGSCTKDGAENDAIRADVRQQVMDNQTPREIIVKKNNVTWAGNLIEGFAINSKDRSLGYAASQSGLTKCWFTTLEVKEGYTNLPNWKQYGWGTKNIDFTFFKNPDFKNYTCYQFPQAEVK